MPFKDWHGGQLLILWSVAVFFGVIEFIAFFVIADEDGPAWILLLILAAFLLTPIVLWVVTWKWFGSKRLRH